MCNKNFKTVANNGRINISAANSNLDGTGNMGLVLTAGNTTNAAGTTIQTIFIKATGNTSLGMVRIFVSDGITKYLFLEINVPAVVQTGVVQAYSYAVNIPFTIKPSYAIYASTQNSDSFNVIANGIDIINCDCTN